MKTSIFSLYPQEITAYCENKKLPKFRQKQLIEWLFEHRVFTLDEMTNLPNSLKEQLKEDFSWSIPQIISRLEGEDNSTKLLLKHPDFTQVYETVIMRYENRTSICVSSQVGCKLACSFCQTGKLGFFRNLACEEILGQFIAATQILKLEDKRVTHIVFMGMGEPLQNYDNTIKAVNLFTRADCLGMSKQKVTISTSGIADKIDQLANDCKASLALSLHACNDTLRRELMPINQKFPLEVLKQSLLNYQKATDQKITFEYILIKDTNCAVKHAKELVKFVHGLRCKVNLIPFNSHPGMLYERPSEEEIKEFQSYLSQRGIPSPVRYSKGLDISAACGQLAGKKMKEDLEQAPNRKSFAQSTTISADQI